MNRYKMGQPHPPFDFGPQPGEVWEHVWNASEDLDIQLCHRVNVVGRNNRNVEVQQWTSPNDTEKHPSFILTIEEMKDYRRVDDEQI